VRKAALVLIVVAGTILIGMRVLGAKGVRPQEADAPDSAPASQTERAFPVPPFESLPTKDLVTTRLGAAPTIDGDLTDWPLGGGTRLNRDTAFSFKGHISDFYDLDAVIRSGWDERTLYFAIEVTDDILAMDSLEIWHDDGIEIGLDGLYDRYAWGEDDHQYSVVADGRTADRGEPAEDVTAATLERADGYTIELAIPMARLLPGRPISGTVMGFTAGLHDDDDGESWDAYLIWEGTNTSSKPEEFGSLIFSERLEERIAGLEARIAELENRTRELLDILSEFEGLPPP